MLKRAISIVSKLQKAGYQAVFAGGYVRDKRLGIDTHNDIDIATSATPDQVQEIFGKTVEVGKSFGVVIVVEDGMNFDVATFRKEEGTDDGRHPATVEFCTMEEDAKRRDLTINGMFFDPISEKTYDFVGGEEGIKEGVIRLIGDPEARIAEDRLRILRVIRFAVQTGFFIETETLLAVNNHAQDIVTVSQERIHQELTKIWKAHSPRKAMRLLFDTGLIDYTLPEVRTLDGVEQPPQYHPEGDCLVHTICVLENLPKHASEELLWAGLLHDIGKPSTFVDAPDRIRFNGHDKEGVMIADIILRRLKFENKSREHIMALIEQHMRWTALPRMKKSKKIRFITMEGFDEHMDLHYADCKGSHGGFENLELAKKLLAETPPERLAPVRLVTGKDLIDSGFKPGPQFREILTAIEDKQRDGEISTREQALEEIKSYTPS